MTSLCIKICGLSDAATLETALEAGADMVGFVNFPKSPRHVALDKMAALADQARGRAQIVVLSVNAEDGELDALNAAVRPDWWQLHGAEDAARVQAVQARFGRPVMKALGVGTREDVVAAQAFFGVADRVLLDAKPPKDATRPGGLGQAFDWSLLDALEPDKSFMLSGGLTPDNVAQAVEATGAQGVDVSSGVESAPGQKDAALIKTFVAAARAASTPSKIRTSA
jgi:phosphoribosylanthranilate isomerase